MSTVTIIESETYEQRLERMHEYQDKKHKWPNVIAVVTRPEGNHAIKEWHLTNNIVTNAGNVFYAQKAAGQTPTNDFTGASTGRIELRTGTVATPLATDTYASVTTPVTASRLAIDSTYPKAGDTDPDNTGAGTNIVTNRYSWTTSSFSGTSMLGGCIHSGGNSPSPSGTPTPLQCHWNFASPVTKTTSDTLKTIVNHTLQGQP